MTELNSSLASKPALPPLLYAIGIDVGSLTCSVCIMPTDKTVVGKPLQFPNSTEGQEWLNRKLVQLGCEKAELCVGLEATSRYGENLVNYGCQVLEIPP